MEDYSAIKDLNTVCFWLIKKLCLDFNATEATYTVEGFHNNITGEKLGDYEIIVRKKSSLLPKKEEE